MEVYADSAKISSWLQNNYEYETLQRITLQLLCNSFHPDRDIVITLAKLDLCLLSRFAVLIYQAVNVRRYCDVNVRVTNEYDVTIYVRRWQTIVTS